MNGTPLRFLGARDLRTPGEVLHDLADAVPADAEPDVYGEGALIADLEHEVAALLGKEAAVFGLSGKTLQLAALRVAAERRGRTVVATHGRAHIVEDEDDAAGRLWGLRLARAGRLVDPFTVDDLAALTDPLAAVLVELPLRRAGFRVPPFADLAALAAAAHDRGAAAHLDGARIWEVAPGYGRSHAEIAAPFDAVYVSFYKGLGGLAGGALAADAETVAAVRAWASRAGTIVYHAYPFALAARAGLRRELPQMPAYYAHACALAAALAGLDGVRVAPDPPAATAFVVHVRGDVAALEAAGDRVAERHGILLFRWLIRTPHPGWSAFEVSVGASSLAIAPDEARAAVADLVALAESAETAAR